MNILIPTSVVGLAATEVFLLLGCFTVAVFLTTGAGAEIFLVYDAGFARIAIIVSVLVVGFYFQDLYEDIRVRSKLLLFQKVCLVLGLAFLLQALLSYTSPDWILPRRDMMVGSGMVLVALPVWRIIYSGLLGTGRHAERVLFLGAGRVAQEIAGRMNEQPRLGMAAIGYVGDPNETDAPAENGKVLGPLEALREIVAASSPDRIVVALSEWRNRLPLSALLDLRFAGIRIEEAASAYEAAFGRVSTRELRPSQLAFSSELGPRTNITRLQTMYSMLIALVATVLTAPLMAIIAVAVRLTSPGPIFDRQTRIGLNDKTYVLYRFRSMYMSTGDSGDLPMTKNEPRLTPVGRILRLLWLDGLPQFFNILRDEMSLVGPQAERPQVVRTLAERIPLYRQRHCVKPGMTGWAQIHGPYSRSPEDAITSLEYDLYYIKNLTPALDSYIILQTLKLILSAQRSQ